ARVLISIADAAGNTLTVNRDAGNGDRITSVVDASDRALNFSYDPTSGVLDDVEESFVLPDLSVARQWTFTYDANSRLSSVTDPLSPAGVININEYSNRGRIIRIADKNGDEFFYAYNGSGFIKVVLGPAPFSHLQTFSYLFATTTYTDRRAAQWKFRHTTGTKRLEVVTDPFIKVVLLAYDSDFNVTSFTDQLTAKSGRSRTTAAATC
ncbi:MAG: hypothetical protein O7D91_02075, partial [Planctomycetota bacterium]|nr:hypothetical protein [Planctomycetota bacterium]